MASSCRDGMRTTASSLPSTPGPDRTLHRGLELIRRTGRGVQRGTGQPSRASGLDRIFGYEHAWSRVFTTVVTYGVVNVSNLDIQPEDAFHRTQRTSMNLMWNPVPFVDIVVEYLAGTRVNKDGQRGSSSQIPGRLDAEVLTAIESEALCPARRDGGHYPLPLSTRPVDPSAGSRSPAFARNFDRPPPPRSSRQMRTIVVASIASVVSPTALRAPVNDRCTNYGCLADGFHRPHRAAAFRKIRVGFSRLTSESHRQRKTAHGQPPSSRGHESDVSPPGFSSRLAARFAIFRPVLNAPF